MPKKNRVGVIGGLSKMLRTNGDGTIIDGYSGQILTLDQLKQLLGITNTTGNDNTNPGTPTSGSIAVGPGLTGGGPMVGVVQINLEAPRPIFLYEDNSDDVCVLAGGAAAPAQSGGLTFAQASMITSMRM